MNRSAVEIIKKYNSGRLPELVQKKYEIMASNPFSFFRGTCHLFYQDLLSKGALFPDPTQTWLCGDLHMENFGVYKGENQLVYFDINDFDESTLGPCTYDLSRFISSLYLSSNLLGLNSETMDDLAHHFLVEFSKILASGRSRVVEEPCAQGIISYYFKQIESRSRKTLLKEWLEDKGGKIRFKKSNPHLLSIPDVQKEALFAFVKDFLIQYYPHKALEPSEKGMSKKASPLDRVKPLDAAIRIAGTGSLGLNRFLVAAELDGKIKLVDIKQAQYPSLDELRKGPKWASDGERICVIQSMMQGTSPGMLYFKEFDKKNYVIRALQPEVDKLDLLEIKSRKSKIKDIITDMALLTASAYLRSSGWKNSSNKDVLVEFGNRTDWHKPVLEYAKAYVQQVLTDYEAFKDSQIAKKPTSKVTRKPRKILALKKTKKN